MKNMSKMDTIAEDTNEVEKDKTNRVDLEVEGVFFSMMGRKKLRFCDSGKF